MTTTKERLTCSTVRSLCVACDLGKILKKATEEIFPPAVGRRYATMKKKVTGPQSGTGQSLCAARTNYRKKKCQDAGDVIKRP